MLCLGVIIGIEGPGDHPGQRAGMGRNGQARVIQRDHIAKGLCGGIPIGAVLATGRAADLLGPGTHGTTYGGNPVACAAALAVLHVIERDGLLQHVRDLGASWRAELAEAHPLVRDVRGLGLHLGVVLDQPVAATAARVALEHGFIVNAPAPDAIRLAPPLILTSAQAASFTQALPGILDQAIQETA